MSSTKPMNRGRVTVTIKGWGSRQFDPKRRDRALRAMIWALSEAFAPPAQTTTE